MLRSVPADTVTAHDKRSALGLDSGQPARRLPEGLKDGRTDVRHKDGSVLRAGKFAPLGSSNFPVRQLN